MHLINLRIVNINVRNNPIVIDDFGDLYRSVGIIGIEDGMKMPAGNTIVHYRIVTSLT